MSQSWPVTLLVGIAAILFVSIIVFCSPVWFLASAAAPLSTPSMTPVPGRWVGTTSRNRPMSFAVSPDSTQWATFTLGITYTAPPCKASGSGSFVHEGPGEIVEGHFQGPVHNYSFEGWFTASDMATGTYRLNNVIVPVPVPYPPYLEPCLISDSGTWTARADIPTPTPTQTPTRTPSNTRTASRTETSTRTGTPSRTPTLTKTAIATPSPTQTRTPTNTWTPTRTGTPTLTPTPSRTHSPTVTPSLTKTATVTLTPEATRTTTSTATPSPAPTGTETSTRTPSPTVTLTRTVTSTPPPAPTLTNTSTRTGTPTCTATATTTPTLPPLLDVYPRSLTFLTGPGLLPITHTVSISNTGYGTLAWTASTSAPWLAISPSSGTASADAPGAMIVGANAETPGVFETEITVSSDTAGVLGSPKKVHVTLSNGVLLRQVFLPITLRD